MAVAGYLGLIKPNAQRKDKVETGDLEELFKSAPKFGILN